MIWNHHSLTLLPWCINTQETALWSKRATSLYCLKGKVSFSLWPWLQWPLGELKILDKQCPAEVSEPHQALEVIVWDSKGRSLGSNSLRIV